jgi:hypothetical protein
MSILFPPLQVVLKTSIPWLVFLLQWQGMLNLSKYFNPPHYAFCSTQFIF